VQDAHTGELLAAGHGSPEDFGVAVERLEARRGERWFFTEQVWHEVDLPVPKCPVVAGLPSSLAQVIFAWVGDGDEGEVAGFIGWDVERVKAFQ
jgi:hypothetical protein